MAENHETFLEHLAKDQPRLAVKYMAHLAAQIDDRINPESAHRQIISAKVAGNENALAIAHARDTALREKFTKLADAFFAEHFILAGYVRDDGQIRAISDVRVQELTARQAQLR